MSEGERENILDTSIINPCMKKKYLKIFLNATKLKIIISSMCERENCRRMHRAIEIQSKSINRRYRRTISRARFTLLATDTQRVRTVNRKKYVTVAPIIRYRTNKCPDVRPTRMRAAISVRRYRGVRVTVTNFRIACDTFRRYTFIDDLPRNARN